MSDSPDTLGPSPDNTVSPAAGLRWRLGLLIVTGTLAAALLISGISRYRAAKDNSRTMVEAEVFSVLVGARRELGRVQDNRMEVLADLFDELKTQGAGYIAILDPSGKPMIAVGRPKVPLFLPRALQSQRRGPPHIEIVGDGTLAHAYVVLGRAKRMARDDRDRGRGILAMEFRSTASQNIVKGARRAMILELGAAALLMLAAVVFWRLSRNAERLWNQVAAQREEAQGQMERDRQLKILGQMSAVLGHELKNPIAALKGHAQLLLEQLETDHPATGGARTILTEAVHLQHLTSQVLDFAKTGEITPQRVYLDDLAHGAVATADAGDVQVVVPQETTFPLDRSRMMQVLTNLLRNARQACGDKNLPITLTMAVAGSLVITVADTGPGIRPGDEERIFEPFQTSRATGTGLGLALARMIVESHGGTITAENRPEGGALFTVTIPPRGATS